MSSTRAQKAKPTGNFLAFLLVKSSKICRLSGACFSGKYLRPGFLSGKSHKFVKIEINYLYPTFLMQRKYAKLWKTKCGGEFLKLWNFHFFFFFFFFWIEAKTTPRNLFFIILFSLQLVFKIISIEGKKWVEFVALQLNNATWLKHNERYSRGLPLKQYSSRPEK